MNAIKKSRKEQLMTQAQLAEKVGATLGSVQNWERGITRPFPRLQKRLQEVLGIDLRAIQTEEVA